MNFFATLDANLLATQGPLATWTGLSELSADALAQEALPALVCGLITPGALGAAAQVLETCRTLALNGTQHNLAAITRAGGGWPAQRQQLANALLGPPYFAQLTHRYVPTAPAQAADLLGCYAVVVLATAGQYALQTEAEAPDFMAWLEQQVAAIESWRPLGGPLEVVAAEPAAFRLPAVVADRKAPWWPLLVLAIIGIVASSYFWNEQVAMAAQAATRAVKKVAVASLAPVARFVASYDSAAAPAAPVVALAKPVSETPVVPTSLTVTAPDLMRPELAADELEQLSPKDARLLLADSLAAKPAALPRKSAAATPAVPIESRSAESQLYKRLLMGDLARQQPIRLNQIEFNPGQSTLSVAGTQQLENIAAVLKPFPKCRLLVLGYAEENEPQALALERARVVVAEMLRLGVRSSIPQAQAYSPGASKLPLTNERRSPMLLISAVE